MANPFRIVVKFDTKKIKLWIHPNTGASETKLDVDARKLEFDYLNDLYKPIEA